MQSGKAKVQEDGGHAAEDKKKLVTYFMHKPTDRNYLKRIPNHHELLLPKPFSPIPLLLPFRHFLVIP